MQTMQYCDFQKLLNEDQGDYFVGRWEYFKVVIDIVHSLNPSSVLELGPGKHTIVKECDVMLKPEDDRWGRPVNPVHKFYLHDATEKPWPIPDKKYDLFIEGNDFLPAFLPRFPRISGGARLILPAGTCAGIRGGRLRGKRNEKKG